MGPSFVKKLFLGCFALVYSAWFILNFFAGSGRGHIRFSPSGEEALVYQAGYPGKLLQIEMTGGKEEVLRSFWELPDPESPRLPLPETEIPESWRRQTTQQVSLEAAVSDNGKWVALDTKARSGLTLQSTETKQELLLSEEAPLTKSWQPGQDRLLVSFSSRPWALFSTTGETLWSGEAVFVCWGPGQDEFTVVTTEQGQPDIYSASTGELQRSLHLKGVKHLEWRPRGQDLLFNVGKAVFFLEEGGAEPAELCTAGSWSWAEAGNHFAVEHHVYPFSLEYYTADGTKHLEFRDES